MPGRTILTIDVQGFPELVAKLGKATADVTLKAPLEKGADRLRAAMQKYPPPPSGSTYVRTGNLGRSWGDPRVSGLVATVSEDAESPSGVHYGPFVQGAHDQAEVHQGRWLTDEQAIEQEAPLIGQDFKDAIQSALNS